jgi:hypothetical protein
VDRRRITFWWDKQARQERESMQVRTEPADLANTILKMASKRAKIAMTLNVTAASDAFTQDAEDVSERLRQAVADEEGGEATGNEQRKGPQSNAEANGTIDKTTGEITGKKEEQKESPPASDGMLRLIRAKLVDKGIDELTFCKQHNLEALPGITFAKGNELLLAIAKIAVDAQKAAGNA